MKERRTLWIVLGFVLTVGALASWLLSSSSEGVRETLRILSPRVLEIALLLRAVLDPSPLRARLIEEGEGALEERAAHVELSRALGRREARLLREVRVDLLRAAARAVGEAEAHLGRALVLGIALDRLLETLDRLSEAARLVVDHAEGDERAHEKGLTPPA